MSNEEIYEQECEQVIKLMQNDFPLANDWNVIDDSVQILDKDDTVIGNITTDRLTEYWNVAEGCLTIKLGGAE